MDTGGLEGDGGKLTGATVCVGEGAGLAAGGLLGGVGRVELGLADGVNDVLARVGVGREVSEDGLRAEAVGEAGSFNGNVELAQVGSGVGSGRGNESEDGGGELHVDGLGEVGGGGGGGVGR